MKIKQMRAKNREPRVRATSYTSLRSVVPKGSLPGQVTVHDNKKIKTFIYSTNMYRSSKIPRLRVKYSIITYKTCNTHEDEEELSVIITFINSYIVLK